MTDLTLVELGRVQAERDEAIRKHAELQQLYMDTVVLWNAAIADRDRLRDALTSETTATNRALAQRDARIQWQAEAVVHMKVWRDLFDTAVAMREGHEGCVTEPKCGSCFRCDFDRAVDEAMTAIAAGSECFIEESSAVTQLEKARAAAIQYAARVDELGLAADDNDPRVMACAEPIGAAQAILWDALGMLERKS